ncbi:hypothetical protein BEL05_06255 [Shewanella colwelliana]|uniref:DUF3592 domain-containing protein n=1 Tax=Shewanella colwelliana TaxID=23 RepID=A0A1E5ISK9_SHECO|nr:hypothetical protein [Shewanella colwelliana]OEG72998.1 hypothetical protein BEL05_06255 [Shewanella colwelliana]
MALDLHSSSDTKVVRRIVFVLWAACASCIFLLGNMVVSNFIYIEQSQFIEATVIKKVASKSRSGSGSSASYSTALKVIYQFENPYVKDKLELHSELAPLVYGRVKEGDTISVYFNEMAKPKTRISQPFHFWLLCFLVLLGVSFLYLIALIIGRHSRLVVKTWQANLILTCLFLVPVVYQSWDNMQNNNAIALERNSEANWPRWFAFEHAVAKPSWWDSVAIKYLDPMDYTSEEHRYYLKSNTDADRFHRSFKLTYALMLRHQDDPLELGWLLAKGTTRQYMPMYEFFLSHFMYRQWEGVCTNPCNDATQMVEMAGHLLSMKLDENQIASSLVLAEEIMVNKYDRADNRGKFYFLYSYRRLLEHTQGKDIAHAKLDDLVDASTLEAQKLGNSQLLSRWQRFWHGTQREVGMFSG